LVEGFGVSGGNRHRGKSESKRVQGKKDTAEGGRGVRLTALTTDNEARRNRIPQKNLRLLIGVGKRRRHRPSSFSRGRIRGLRGKARLARHLESKTLEQRKKKEEEESRNSAACPVNEVQT